VRRTADSGELAAVAARSPAGGLCATIIALVRYITCDVLGDDVCILDEAPYGNANT
jgi:hypothetical protein